MDTGKYAEEYRKQHNLPSLPELIHGTSDKTQPQAKAQPQTKSQSQAKTQPQDETQSQNPITFLMGKTLELMKQAQVYGQAYEQLQQNYMKVADIYQNQLMQILPSIAMLTAKTPLSSMTEDDLTQHIEQLYTTVPFQVALANTDKLIKGYYIAKINGINTKELDTADLLQVADNPAFAQSTNDNLAKFLAQLGGIIQLKMQTALKQAGMVKDMYNERLKDMEIQAQVMHEIATGLINMAKLNETERHHLALEELSKEKLDFYKQIENIKEQLEEMTAGAKIQELDAYINRLNAETKLLESKLANGKNAGSKNNPSNPTGSNSKPSGIQQLPP